MGRPDPRDSETVSDLSDNQPAGPGLDGAGAVVGRVVSRDQSSVSNVTVAVMSGPGPLPDIASVTDSSGGYEIGDLPAGDYKIAFHAPDGRLRTCTLQVRDNQSVRCDIELG